ncbi:hypothetical protein SLV14_002752 [Streptomyces sp. Je 1-4]|uniref:hypothetical protein n=1 Tax=Streptomyces TaxID=1883 RepID=UPI0021DA97B6|nr:MULTISPECIES: hypothetical protein [unclassified Streptomyces]UYB40162.1 hypothetical protein SLV14_002752 [Streptomyces sp. Je 1-4]UZQ36253.1 hypothetical protein SLV14N_002752 [Streptomyces sp. Je 1-4] [Streptomyces sp. Je 1-4 4N24]UZQ43671.1 hypothetical protein SLV14NA_002752 [Streptomyces sp. Je 1-4] [Streptomyces sp. Je 1-4 4N24_ara]
MRADETIGMQVNGAAPQGKSADLTVEAEMVKFKKRVDDLLARLKGSNADPGTLGSRTIAPASFGQGFAEAQGLSAAYEKVLSQLEAFSKAFGDQIETLGIGSEVAYRKYEAIDADAKSRLAAIQRRTQELYRAPRPEQRPAEAAGSAEAGMGDGKSAGADGI